MKMPKFSGRVWTTLFFALVLFAFSAIDGFLLMPELPVRHFSPAIFGMVTTFAGGCALLCLARIYHLHDLAEYRRKALKVLPPSRQLSIDERVALAVRFYGLYTFSLELANARSVLTPVEKRQLLMGDLQCAMDNMRVPFQENQLTAEQRDYLAEFDVRQEMAQGSDT